MSPALYALAVVLLGALGLIFWQPEPSPPEPAPGPGGAAEASAPETGPPGDDGYRAPAASAGDPAAAERREETLDAPPWATVLGQLTKPAWATFPGDMVLRLEPQDGTDGEERTILLQPGRTRFRFDQVPYGHWRLELRAAGFRHDPQLLSLSPEDPERHFLVPLQPDRAIRGRVSAADGSPAAGALISATRVAKPGRAVLPLTARSDALGEFVITGASPGSYRVQPGPSRSPIGDPVQIYFAPEAREAFVELQLPPTGAAVVQVTNTKDGAALQGVRLTATLVSPGRRGHVAAGASDAEGRCSFLHLPVGEYAIQSVAGRYRSGTVRTTVLEGGQAEVELPVIVR